MDVHMCYVLTGMACTGTECGLSLLKWIEDDSVVGCIRVNKWGHIVPV